MNILVYEYFSAGGTDGVLEPADLCGMGWAMLHACIEDCLDAGHQVHTMIDRRLLGKLPAGCKFEVVPEGQSLSTFKKLLKAVDAVLAIAPETDDTLAVLTSLVEESGRLSLGSTSQATRIAGDKFAASLALMARGCKVPATALWPVTVGELRTPGPWILKPRRGAGCEGIYLTSAPEAVTIPSREYLIQEYVPGTAASVAMIAGKSSTLVLSLNLQKIVFAPDPRYEGGALPLTHPLAKAAFECARIVTQAIPGLRGYLGVDMVLTSDEVYVIEVNPRITCAYCGLRQVASINLIELIIQAALGFDLPGGIRLTDSVQFDGLGTLSNRGNESEFDWITH